MELFYKGSVRALRGSSMAFAHPEGKFNDQHMHSFLSLGIQDMALRMDEIKEDGIAFTISFFNEQTPYFLKSGESLEIKKEGNAFACHLVFTIG